MKRRAGEYGDLSSDEDFAVTTECLGNEETADVNISVPTFTETSKLDEIYHQFFHGSGCVILRNVFTPDLMNRVNVWCECELARSVDANGTHPKQPDKKLINGVVERMAITDPDLLLCLVANPQLNGVLDKLLGLSCVGSMTSHWISPGGRAQTAHVDYPCHVNSGAFWEGNPALLDRYLTPYQINHVLPYCSVQTVIATDGMNSQNGSTQVIPGSQMIPDVDRLVLDKIYVDQREREFVSVSLEAGDVLLFNRRLIHRGGENRSQCRRNAIIMQNVYLFGVPQHAADKDDLNTAIDRVTECGEWTRLTAQQQKETLYRLRPPFPTNTRDHN